jgi:hypothetical protein
MIVKAFGSKRCLHNPRAIPETVAGTVKAFGSKRCLHNPRAIPETVAGTEENYEQR